MIPSQPQAQPLLRLFQGAKGIHPYDLLLTGHDAGVPSHPAGDTAADSSRRAGGYTHEMSRQLAGCTGGPLQHVKPVGGDVVPLVEVPMTTCHLPEAGVEKREHYHLRHHSIFAPMVVADGGRRRISPHEAYCGTMQYTEMLVFFQPGCI